MKTNSRMRQIIGECPSEHGPLDGALGSILRSGLVYSDGCVLLKSQVGSSLGMRGKFQDETGYECFVNHIHLEDILRQDDTCALLGQALAFSNELAVLKSNAGVSESLEYIIALDEGEVNVRFHAIRPGQNWLVDDLEAYEEAVATIWL